MRSPNVRVLFVHGVGRHERLSSLLQAYQALRSNRLSPEPPVSREDPIPQWALTSFDEGSPLAHLKLTQKYPGQPDPQNVYFYEVNYSSLAGIIRENQPLDITRLFVGLSLAFAVGRKRLRIDAPPHPGVSAVGIDHLAVADSAQCLADVFVAATVPILGVFPFLLKQFTGTFVAQFIRFFEDIATFAMDKNGEKLISAHIDETIRRIAAAQTEPQSEGDDLIVVAHSLGSVVAHNYLVRHWPAGKGPVPKIFLTLGAPIGLVCWMWLFLDFVHMEFPAGHVGAGYFCWDPEKCSSVGTMRPIRWLNVVNHMDPIATSFPTDYAYLGIDPAVLSPFLAGGISHHFLRKGGPLSAATAHTSYFDDRNGFIRLLDRVIGLEPGEIPKHRPRQQVLKAQRHWQKMGADLQLLRAGAGASGFLFLLLYLFITLSVFPDIRLFLIITLYALPPVVIGILAFFQNLIWGGPNKRTTVLFINSLREELLDWRTFSSFPRQLWSIWKASPFLLRRLLAGNELDRDPLSEPPSWFFTKTLFLISLLPFVAAFLTPVIVEAFLCHSAAIPNIFQLVQIPHSWWLILFLSLILCFRLNRLIAWLLLIATAGGWFFDTWNSALVMFVKKPWLSSLAVIFFVLYVLSYAVSEFARHWRNTILALRP